MRRVSHLLLSFLVCQAALADGNATLHSVKEVLSETAESYIQSKSFALHGKIAANGLRNIALFRDATGVALITFKTPDLSYPKAGSIVSIKGHLDMRSPSDRTIYATTYEVEQIQESDPPTVVSLEQLPHKNAPPSFVQVTGTVIEVYPDEVDANFTYVILHAQGRSVCISAYDPDYPYEQLRKLVNARIQVTGIYSCSGHWRRFSQPFIQSPSGIEIIQPAPDDPFAIAPLDLENPQVMSSGIFGTRRRARGCVLAVWQENNVLLKSHGNTLLRARLAKGTPPPRNGQSVEMAGIIDTDGSDILMRDAIWRPTESPCAPSEAPAKTSARALLLDSAGGTAIQYEFNGKLIQLEGKVLTIQRSDNIGSRLLIDSENFTIPVDVSGCPSAAEGLEVGCRISVAGICLIDFDSWRLGAPLPRIRGIEVIVREANDIQILSRPSPFTARRLTTVILVLLLGLAVFFAWNRLLRKLVDRKSRELFKSQISRAESELRINERTRLAAELHDDTVQGLTAVAYRISEAQSSLSDSEDETRDNLRIAAKMLKSCRTNLRRCLWDLRSDVLDDPDFGHAIVRTTENVAGDATVRVRFAGRRSLLSDTAAHAILNILRELVANAVNHGHADEIKIAGECHQGALYVSVRDNGTGFDPENRPAQEDGHFGLDGIQERLAHLGGTLSIRSSAGRGTYVRISIAAITQQNGNSPS